MRFHATVTLISLAILAPLAGCSGSSPPSSATSPSAPSPSAPSAATSYVDRLGRTIAFNTAPKRVISLSPETTELLYAIGAGEVLVGATDYCNYPAAAKELPKVGGGTLETLSLEAMVELQPELVLCKWDSHQPLVDRLQQVGIQAFAVGPTGIASLYDEADQLGRLFDCHARARQWTIDMKRKIQTQRDRVAAKQLARRPKVFYQVWHEPLMSVNDASFIGELLELAGLANIFADLQAPFPTVSAEAVVQRNPDIILAPDTGDTVVDEILDRPGWNTVAAIKQRRIYLINPDTISRCGPRLSDALEEIVDHVYGKDRSGDEGRGEPDVVSGPAEGRREATIGAGEDR